MRVTLLAFIARLLGIQFHIYGLPFGADYQRSVQTLARHKTLGKWGPPLDPDGLPAFDGAPTF